ncbi:hypothetical protein CMU07_09120 [Elizabethkingia anophelis]|nr:hypothetical protein [Elizabethkingia anophelis]
MSEFKGTKGKWEIQWMGSLLSIIGAKKSERKANAQLISKAPEILEMLKRISTVGEKLWEQDEENIIFDEIDFLELDHLIKQATE